jgi:hypothetical protein
MRHAKRICENKHQHPERNASVGEKKGSGRRADASLSNHYAGRPREDGTRSKKGGRMIFSQEFMSIEEACQECGLTKRGLYPHIRQGEFLATLPFGRTGGWHISRHSFREWLMGRIGRGANRRNTATRRKQP